MSWHDAINRAVFYLFAHVVLLVLVGGLVSIGTFFISQAGPSDPSGILMGILIIIVGLLVAAIGGPAIWIKVIGDIVSSAVPQSNYPSEHPSPVFNPYPQMSVERLIQEAESLGVSFSINECGRPSMNYFGFDNPLSDALREELRIRQEEVLAFLQTDPVTS